MASIAMPTLPAVAFLKPTGKDTPEANMQVNYLGLINGYENFPKLTEFSMQLRLGSTRTDGTPTDGV